MRTRIFRWKAIGPLLLLFLLLGAAWALFGDRFVEDTGEEVGTELLGTEVDLNGLRIRETEAAVDLGRVQIADPFDPGRNLLETGTIVFDVEPAALLEKKLVIDRLVIRDLRFNTTRDTPARPARGDGYAPAQLRALREWKKQFDAPGLKLTPIDTIKQLVLDPGQLGTVTQATALLGSADSIQQAFTGQITAVDPRPLIDSAGALSARLAGANPARLGISGTRDAVQSVRRTLRAVDSMRLRLAALQQSGEAGVARLRGGLSSLDDARRQDYDFARSLLQLPRFDAPNIGPALFGQVSIDRFQQVAYWSELVQHYLPPGLRPQQRSGPKRLRRAGTTVLFPKEREYPSFLLRNGELNLALDIGGARHTLQAAVAGVTTQPTLYGHPATVTADGTIGGAHPLSLRVNALVDHTGTVSHDALGAFLGGVHLPAFAVPGLPFKVDPGLGSASLTFSREGDQIVGRWTLRSANAAWTRDSAGGAGQDPVGNLIWQVVSGLQDLQVTAEIKGTLRSPTLSVHSNLDEAIATRLRTLLGEEVARAEAKARAEVDRLVSTQVGAARARVDTYKQLVDERVSQVQQQLDKVKADLESRLRSLTGGSGGILGS